MSDRINIDSLDHKDPRFQNGIMISEAFTKCVDELRNWPHQPVAELMSLFWKLVGNRICPASIQPDVSTLSFWCEIPGGADPDKRARQMIATIICPSNWCDMLRADRYMQLGALVFQASKAKDYWNLKIPGITCTEEAFQERAYSYEAEFLNTISVFSPNSYQKQVLTKYPQGLRSVRRGLHYTSRPFPDVPPPYPMQFRSEDATQSDGPCPHVH
jgi:hypothetical protein